MWTPEILDRLHWKDRGIVVIVASDRETDRAAPSFIGEIILVDSETWRIARCDARAIAQPISVGENVGLVLERVALSSREQAPPIIGRVITRER